VNGVHDMGGMQGFGPIQPENNEPVFHARWEGRVLAMRRLVSAIGKVRSSGFRVELESIPAAEYLSNSYYENWFKAFVEQLVHSGLITHEELGSGKAVKGPAGPVVALEPAEAAALPYRVPPAMMTAEVTRRFKVGQQVRTRNIHPVEHTRLPRYARGRIGVIDGERGVQAFPDTNAYARGENPQPVYSVRFAARELWGEQASARDAVYMDLWDSYLEPA
jgi:nitrile hydratase beta subunit